MYQLLSSYLLTAFCSWVAAFLLPLIVQSITQSAFYTSLAYTISIIPYVVVLPLAGVLGDYFNKKRIIQVGELLNVCFVSWLIFIPFNESHLFNILLVHFCLSAVGTVHHTVFQAIVPGLVATEQISRFNAYASAINNVIALIAPAVVGLWLGIGTTKELLYYLAAGYVFSLFVLSIAKYKHEPPIIRLSLSAIFDSLKEGFQYVNGHRFLRYTVINFFFVNFGESFINANLVHYLKHHNAIAESDLSYYFIPMGIGALLGSLAAPYVIRRVAPGKIIILGSILAVTSTALIFFNSTPWVTTFLWGINEVGASVVIVTFFSLRQRLVPVYLLSRIIAVTRMVGYMAMPLAAMSSGWLFEYTGYFPYLIIISALSMAVGLLLSFRPLWRSEILYELPKAGSKA